MAYLKIVLEGDPVFTLRHWRRGDRLRPLVIKCEKLVSDIFADARLTADAKRAAWLLTAAKAREYDLLVGMDAYNKADLLRLVYPDDRAKVHLLLDFAGKSRDIADPWYTGNFDETYADVLEGCTALLEKIRNGAVR